MESEILETVLLELLEEEKAGNIKLDQLCAHVAGLTTQIKEFKQELTLIKVNIPPIDTYPIENKLFSHQLMVEGYLREMKEFVLSERNKKELREMIYKCLPWILVIVLCLVIFRIAIGGTYYGTLF